MKTNKAKLSPAEKFMIDAHLIMARYYSQALSESIKRGIALKKSKAKKLSTG